MNDAAIAVAPAPAPVNLVLVAITCQRCNARPATVHVTELLPSGGHGEAHLCPSCCQDVGWDGERCPPPVAQLLARPSAGAEAEAATLAERPCPACGLTFADYQQVNLLGCPDCYRAHDQALGEAIRRWHGAGAHVGRLPGSEPPPADTRSIRRAELESRLAAAVAGERYEEAAQLRDELRRVSDG